MVNAADGYHIRPGKCHLRVLDNRERIGFTAIRTATAYEMPIAIMSGRRLLFRAGSSGHCLPGSSGRNFYHPGLAR